jgi:hypothetical protein
MGFGQDTLKLDFGNVEQAGYTRINQSSTQIDDFTVTHNGPQYYTNGVVHNILPFNVDDDNAEFSSGITAYVTIKGISTKYVNLRVVGSASWHARAQNIYVNDQLIGTIPELGTFADFITAENIVVKNGGIALRYFNVYGPGEDHKERMASVAFQMYQKHKAGEKIYLFPKKPKRDFVYIKDVISANLYAAEHFDKLLGKYYEVGSGKAEAFESVLDEFQIPYEYTPESLIPDGYQFFTQSKSEFWMKGWKPEFDIKKGLEDYKKYLDKKCGTFKFRIKPLINFNKKGGYYEY